MASLSVRQLNDKAYQQLRLLAKEHGVSVEEEARRIIYQAVAAPARLGDVFKKHFGPDKGVDLKLPRRKPHQPMDFEE